MELQERLRPPLSSGDFDGLGVLNLTTHRTVSAKGGSDVRIAMAKPGYAYHVLPLMSNGELPPGVHIAALVEFRERFGRSSPRREWLIGRFDALLAQVKATGHLRRMFVWGSFVTQKATPGDLDVLLIMSNEFSAGTLPLEARDVFDAAQAKLTFEADVFWARESIGPEALGLWLDTYQTTRDFRKRGIVELELR